MTADVATVGKTADVATTGQLLILRQGGNLQCNIFFEWEITLVVQG